MKRGREDPLMGSGGKRRRESSGLHQPSESLRLSIDDALAYLKSIKDILKNNREKYHEFLEIMEAFKDQRVSIAGVIARVRDLFKGHHSLILGFNTFLPEGYEITVPPEPLPTSTQSVQLNLAFKYVDKIKTRFQNDELVYKTFVHILSMYEKGEKSNGEVYRELEKLFCAHQDLLDELKRFLAECKGPTPFPNVPASASGQMSGEISIRCSHKENVVNRGKPVILHDNFHESTNVKDERTSMEVENEHCKKVEKEKHKKEDLEQRTSMEVENEHFNKVEKEKDKKEDLERKEKNKGEKRSPHRRRRKMRFRFGDPRKRKFTRKSKQTQTGQVGGCAGKQSLQTTAIANRELEKENGRNKAEDQESYWERDKDRHHKDILNNNASANKEEFTNKPVSELNLSNCEYCTPSYRLLPKNYTEPVASYRTGLAPEVLNDTCVSVTNGSEDNGSDANGSEDYSFEHMRKNEYDEILFLCEEDRFELDVLIESTESTTKSLKELLEKIENNTIKQDGRFEMEDYLTAINLRCIERIYGDHGLDVLDLLRENPTVALRVVLTRLQQKQDEWSVCRAQMNKVWNEVYKKNYVP